LSIHLTDYPTADESLIDHELTDRMTALLRIVSLARSARTASKLKVRQPLASMMVVPATPVEREAVEQFESHVLEELNVKTLIIKESAADLRSVAVRLNKKVAGPKYGKQLAAVAVALEGLNPNFVAASVDAGRSVAVSVEGQALDLEPTEVTVEKSYGEAWSAAEDRGTVVLLDKRVTPELRLEGLARDVVRNVQNLRKDSGLNIEDRIELALVSSDAELKKAVEAFRDYIARETLATAIDTRASEGSAHQCQVEIEGKTLSIALRKKSS
jgi:isoleucyl-tRNA synthetase